MTSSWPFWTQVLIAFPAELSPPAFSRPPGSKGSTRESFGYYDKLSGITFGETCWNVRLGSWFCLERGCGTLAIERTSNNAPENPALGAMAEWSKRVNMSRLYRPKYYIKLPYGQLPANASSRVLRHRRGVALLLHELDNIAHEARDAQFVAHAFTQRSLPISALVSREAMRTEVSSLHKRTRKHFDSSTQALMAAYNSRSASSVANLVGLTAITSRRRMLREQNYTHECFAHAVQKACVPPASCLPSAVGAGLRESDQHLPVAGGPAYPSSEQEKRRRATVGLYREAVYNACAIVPRPAYALLVLRGNASAGSRTWTPEAASNVRALLMAAATQLGVPLREWQYPATFCEQAAQFAHAKLVLAHHGAELGGNLPFLLPGGGVVVELDAPAHNPPGHYLWAKSYGVGYVPCPCIFSLTRKDCSGLQYWFKPVCKIQADEAKLQVEVATAVEMASGRQPHTTHRALITTVR